MSNGPESAERRIFGGRALEGKERIVTATSIIDEGLKHLRRAPEFTQALVALHLEGDGESRDRFLRNGEVLFRRGDFDWASHVTRYKDAYESGVSFSLTKTPPIEDAESKEIEEMIDATLRLNHRGEVLWAYSKYQHIFTSDMRDRDSILDNKEETSEDARKLLDIFRTGNNPL
jgi:hypothetical protein